VRERLRLFDQRCVGRTKKESRKPTFESEETNVESRNKVQGRSAVEQFGVSPVTMICDGRVAFLV